MRFLRWLWTRRSRRPALVEARISVTDDHAYSVRTEPLNELAQSPEYVRLILHYYAQVLFNCGSGEETRAAAVLLTEAMARVSGAPSGASSDVLRAARIDDVVRIEPLESSASVHEIRATLYFASFSDRLITTRFSDGITARQAVFSVFVLMQHCLRYMDARDLRTLWSSLDNMQRMYAAGYEYSDRDNLVLVPNEALGML